MSPRPPAQRRRRAARHGMAGIMRAAAAACRSRRRAAWMSGARPRSALLPAGSADRRCRQRLPAARAMRRRVPSSLPRPFPVENDARARAAPAPGMPVRDEYGVIENRYTQRPEMTVPVQRKDTRRAAGFRYATPRRALYTERATETHTHERA